jgi:anaerobic ribonucleoside-triphosphate reductase activating protein
VHRCAACHNPSTHDLQGGEEFAIDTVLNWIRSLNWKKVTFSGGDPFLQADALYALVSTLKKEGYDIWVYTGYTLDHIKKDSNMEKCLNHIDVLVDGPFIAALKNPSLRFRGSSNQKIHYLTKMP